MIDFPAVNHPTTGVNQATADIFMHGEAFFFDARDRREGLRAPLLADLLQDLAGRLPGDSLQAEEADRKPLRQQALQGDVQILEEEHQNDQNQHQLQLGN